MSETTRSARGRRGRGGREGRRAEAAAAVTPSAPYVKRKIPFFEVLDEEGLQLIEHNADTILEETGIEFRDMPEALDILKEGGAEVDGVRVRFHVVCVGRSCRPRRQRDIRNTRVIPPKACGLAVKTPYLFPPMAAPSYLISIRADVTPRSKISRTSSSWPIPHPACITQAAPSASRLTYQLTSAISTWFTRISNTPTRLSWAR